MEEITDFVFKGHHFKIEGDKIVPFYEETKKSPTVKRLQQELRPYEEKLPALLELKNKAEAEKVALEKTILSCKYLCAEQKRILRTEPRNISKMRNVERSLAATDARISAHQSQLNNIKEEAYKIKQELPGGLDHLENGEGDEEFQSEQRIVDQRKKRNEKRRRQRQNQKDKQNVPEVKEPNPDLERDAAKNAFIDIISQELVDFNFEKNPEEYHRRMMRPLLSLPPFTLPASMARGEFDYLQSSAYVFPPRNNVTTLLTQIQQAEAPDFERTRNKFIYKKRSNAKKMTIRASVEVQNRGHLYSFNANLPLTIIPQNMLKDKKFKQDEVEKLFLSITKTKKFSVTGSAIKN